MGEVLAQVEELAADQLAEVFDLGDDVEFSVAHIIMSTN